jgi:hypothetical protein
MRSRPNEKNRVTPRRGVGCCEVLDSGELEFVANKRLDLIDDLLYTTPQSLSGDFFKYSISNGRAFDEYDHWLNLFVFWAGNGDPGCRKCW